MPATFEEVINAHVARQLTKRRIEVGMTQKQVAKTVGVLFQTYQTYEYGKSRLFGDSLYLLAKALDTKVDYFFEGCELNDSVKALVQESNIDPNDSPLLARQFDAIPSPEIKNVIRNMIRALEPGD